MANAKSRGDPSVHFKHPTSRTASYHQVKIHMIRVQILERRLNSLGHDVMPRIIELRRQPYLISWNTRVLDTLPNLGFVAIRKSCVDVTVALLEGNLDGVAHFGWFALPSAQANRWDLSTGIESEGLPEVRDQASLAARACEREHTGSFWRLPWLECEFCTCE